MVRRFAVLCLLWLSGCLGCTDRGAFPGLEVNVVIVGGTLPAGDYTVLARVGPTEVRSDIAVAVGSAGILYGGDAVVDGKSLFLDAVLFDTEGRLLVGFREGGGPETVTIEIQRDGATLAQQTFTPAYDTFSPNGDHCEPHVERAYGTLEMPAQ